MGFVCVCLSVVPSSAVRRALSAQPSVLIFNAELNTSHCPVRSMPSWLNALQATALQGKFNNSLAFFFVNLSHSLAFIINSGGPRTTGMFFDLELTMPQLISFNKKVYANTLFRSAHHRCII